MKTNNLNRVKQTNEQKNKAPPPKKKPQETLKDTETNILANTKIP